MQLIYFYIYFYINLFLTNEIFLLISVISRHKLTKPFDAFEYDLIINLRNLEHYKIQY